MKGYKRLKRNISIIGGDLRLCYLARILSYEGYNVYTYGLDKAKMIDSTERIYKLDDMKMVIDKSDVILSSIPLMMDDENIKAPFANFNILVRKMMENMKNKKFIAGKIPSEFVRYAENNNIELIDIVENEELAILNSISTVEGAIKIAIEETNFTIHGSSCLVLGFGRIGKVLSKALKGLGANVYCEARKKTDIAWIKALGYTPVELDNMDVNLKEKNIIFNTIPSLILNKERLKIIDKDTVIIDLASKPGGLDIEYANKVGIKNIWALALPRKGCTI